MAKRIISELLAFLATAAFLVLVVGFAFIQKIPAVTLPLIDEYTPLGRDIYAVSGGGGTEEEIRVQQYEITNKDIEKYIDNRDYLPGNTDPFYTGTSEAESDDQASSKKDAPPEKTGSVE